MATIVTRDMGRNVPAGCDYDEWLAATCSEIAAQRKVRPLPPIPPLPPPLPRLPRTFLIEGYALPTTRACQISDGSRNVQRKIEGFIQSKGIDLHHLPVFAWSQVSAGVSVPYQPYIAVIPREAEVLTPLIRREMPQVLNFESVISAIIVQGVLLKFRVRP